MLLYSLPLFLGKKDFSDYLQIANGLDATMQKKREVFQSLTFCKVWDRPVTRLTPIFYLFPRI